MPIDQAIVNGVLQPLAEARISVLDLGFLRGLAVFETLRTYDGHPHALADHLERLRRSCTGIEVDLPLDEATVRTHIAAALRASGAENLRLTLLVTPGDNISGIFGATTPNHVIIARVLHPPPARWYREGIKVITFPGSRLRPELKTTTYITGRHGLAEAERRGADEALYLDDTGHVSEGVTSNVLALRDEIVYSPSDTCLAGITRDRIRTIAESQGLGWVEAPLPRDDLTRCDEVWITSSVRELVPVVAVDDQTIGDGRPGPWAARIGALYHRDCRLSAAGDAAATAPD